MHVRETISQVLLCAYRSFRFTLDMSFDVKGDCSTTIGTFKNGATRTLLLYLTRRNKQLPNRYVKSIGNLFGSFHQQFTINLTA